MDFFKYLALVALLTLPLAVVACGTVSQDSTGGGVPTAASPADAPPAQGSVPSAAATVAPGLEVEPPVEEPATISAAPVEVTQPACGITPRQTEGPYYFDAGQVRRDITEGKPGTPLLVELQLVEAGSCEPIRGAVVDIWHPDAAGQYSGYRGQGDNGTDTSGETFLRGTQITDANGLVEFETIYPGWYPGRTAHIHFKAYTDERTYVTSQMYFPDDITDFIYLAEPYSARGPRSTRNENDGILTGDTTKRALLGYVTQNGDEYVVSLTIGVVR